MKKLNRFLFLLLVLQVTCYAQKKPVTKTITMGEQVTLNSKILGEARLLNIYLPQGYQVNDTVKYPVIYLLDGSVDEDFIHMSGLVQYCSFEWVNYLPKSIVVGIATVKPQTRLYISHYFGIAKRCLAGNGAL